MGRDEILGFETAIDFIQNRVQGMPLCEKCQGHVSEFLRNLAEEIREKKVQGLELELLGV